MKTSMLLQIDVIQFPSEHLSTSLQPAAQQVTIALAILLETAQCNSQLPPPTMSPHTRHPCSLGQEQCLLHGWQCMQVFQQALKTLRESQQEKDKTTLQSGREKNRYATSSLDLYIEKKCHTEMLEAAKGNQGIAWEIPSTSSSWHIT